MFGQAGITVEAYHACGQGQAFPFLPGPNRPPWGQGIRALTHGNLVS